jgi:hypothetical protein
VRFYPHLRLLAAFAGNGKYWSKLLGRDWRQGGGSGGCNRRGSGDRKAKVELGPGAAEVMPAYPSHLYRLTCGYTSRNNSLFKVMGGSVAVEVAAEEGAVAVERLR